ncbi:YshB family small membrane protein [Pantoea sp. At-9b]|jgi:hypothetical protein|nr:YshB family small membrane protein [Pantoea sp. At-9b]ADU71234.1 conserved hypothetical protein [Pantoea sp. At-9b]
MFQSVIQMITHNIAAIGNAASHSPQTAIAAVICAITVSLFS